MKTEEIGKVLMALRLAKDCTYADEMTEGSKEYLRKAIDDAIKSVSTPSPTVEEKHFIKIRESLIEFVRNNDYGNGKAFMPTPFAYDFLATFRKETLSNPHLTDAQKATVENYPSIEIEDCPKCEGNGERQPDVICIACQGTGIKNFVPPSPTVENSAHSFTEGCDIGAVDVDKPKPDSFDDFYKKYFLQAHDGLHDYWEKESAKNIWTSHVLPLQSRNLELEQENGKMKEKLEFWVTHWNKQDSELTQAREEIKQLKKAITQ